MPSNSSRPEPSEEALELIAARFRVLGEANRLRLIRALQAGDKNVSDLMDATGLAQANVSRHLQTLTDAGILARRKEGLKVIYSIVDHGIFKLCEHVCGTLERRLTQQVKALRV